MTPKEHKAVLQASKWLQDNTHPGIVFKPKHSLHDWLIKDHNIKYRDIDEQEYVLDEYVCECGAGGFIKTPIEMFKKGLKSMDFKETYTPTPKEEKEVEV